jgi:UPF0755 protein
VNFAIITANLQARGIKEYERAMSDHAGTEQAFGRRPEQPNPIVPKSASEALRPEKGTPPPRRSRQARNQFVVFLNFLLSAVVFATIGAALLVYYGKREFDSPGPATETDTVLVKPNTGLIEIADILERNGLISDARIFRFGVQAYGHDDELKAGEYEIKAGASMRDIMELLRSGRSVLYSLTIPEGLTVEQAFQRIASNEALTGEMPSELPPEGSLATDTQRFTRGTTRQEVIDKMLADQKRLVESIWERRVDGLPIETIEEFVTLASIVEKETGRADERPRVAAVFINRLEEGMRLQSDPTIVYGLFGGKGKPADRPIYKSDIDKPTAYNTYVIDGLPPTPIANPGRAALEAVANPSKTEDLYFVADGSGGHVFAASLEEHNENVQRWREIEKQKQDEAAAAAAESGAEPESGAPAEN